MREEIERVVIQGRRDLENARKNIGIGAFEVTAFLCQQSVEKGLKAVAAHRTRQAARKSHDLLLLAQDVAIPKELMPALQEMNPDYSVARYPDAANGVPGLMYTEEKAISRVNLAESVWAWIEQQLGT